MKRLNDDYTLSQVMQEFLKENKLDKGILELKIKEAWEEVMGNGIKNYTKEVIVKNNKVSVYLTSAVVREELSLGKSKIISMLNEHMKSEIIKEIQFF
jgi:hypothetical protein